MLKFFIKDKNIDVRNINFTSIKNILIVRQHNQLGDMMMSLPLLSAVRRKFPESKITLIASPDNFYPLEGDAGNLTDEIIIYDKSNLFNIFLLIFKLIFRKYDMGIVPSPTSISRTSHIINFLSGAKIRAGVKSINEKVNKFAHLLNVKSAFIWGNDVHESIRNLDIAGQIGCTLTREQLESVSLIITYREDKTALKFIQENAPDRKKISIGIHCGAGKPQNRWNTINFTELISELNKKTNCNIFLTSGSMDKEPVTELEKQLKLRNINYKKIENTNARQVGAILRYFSLYITNDTGILHLAGYCGAKVLGLFGPSKGPILIPFKENCHYIQSKSDNINDITVQEVFNKALSIIEEGK